jgi:hypothetical protein
MTESARNRVAETVWPRVRRVDEAVETPGGMPRQAKAALQALVTLIIAWLLHRYGPHPVMGKIVAACAGVVLVSGLFIPPLFYAIERGGQKLGGWVATGLTWLLLVPFFYLVFVPGRVLLALRGVDPMQRRFPTGDPTYWYPRPPVKDPAQYRKQH